MTDQIIYIKGTSKQDKAAFLVGKEKLPAAVVTRLLTAIQGMVGPKLDRTFYQSLAKYPGVLDTMDNLGLTPVKVSEKFREIQEANRPARTEGTRRASKLERIAEGAAKILCKRFKGSSNEMVEEFFQVMRKSEFKSKVLEFIENYEKEYGKNTLGHVKTSARKGNPAAKKALAKARAGKKG